MNYHTTEELTERKALNAADEREQTNEDLPFRDIERNPTEKLAETLGLEVK